VAAAITLGRTFLASQVALSATDVPFTAQLAKAAYSECF
jgi:hypothetical protein